LPEAKTRKRVPARKAATKKAAAKATAANEATAPKRAPKTEPLLKVRDLKAGYGALPVLHGISFDVNVGETAVFLGLNGAGKSTTVLNLCGAVKPWGGSIEFDGKDTTGWTTPRCVQEGIVLVPEGRRVFPELSVEKNLLVGSWSQRGERGWFDQQREKVYDYLPRLRERQNQMAGTLSGGEQQMLAIGRGLMAKPKLLIIDEASLGLAPVIVKEVFRIVSHISEDGVTVILVEANISALDIADMGLVFEKGVIRAEVRGKELENPAQVRQLLMG
jgi:branched-chain amino acid transport system ATP-binding protein